MQEKWYYQDIGSMSSSHLTLIITGSIAAVKSFDLIQHLQAKSIDVSVILTDAAQQWITKEAAELASGNPALTAADIKSDPGAVSKLLSKSDAILAAPASADFIKQLAFKDSDLAKAINDSGKPLAISPAMNVMMWQHPATQRNSKALLAEGVQFLGPVQGKMACGDVGYGRFMEPAQIADAVKASLEGKEHLAFAGVKNALIANPALPAIEASLAAMPNKKLLLLIQGGKDTLATYSLISSLRSHGYDVTCAASPEAQVLLPAQGLATMANKAAYTHHYQDDVQGMEHIRLPEQSDIVMIAPATAAGISDMARGGAQSFLGCLYLATKKPVVLVPTSDLAQQPNAADLERLKQDGVSVLSVPKQLSPASKQRAQAIADSLDSLISQKSIEGKSYVNG